MLTIDDLAHMHFKCRGDIVKCLANINDLVFGGYQRFGVWRISTIWCLADITDLVIFTPPKAEFKIFKLANFNIPPQSNRPKSP